MNKDEYLKQLEHYLKKLPQKDYENAVEYFSEYFEEAGAENEQKVITELGTPKEAAGELIRDLLAQKTEKGGDKGSRSYLHNIIAVAVLSILTASVSLPVICLGIAVVVCAVLLIVCILVFMLCFDIMLIIFSGRLLFCGIAAVNHSLPGAFMFTGAGIFGVGCVILLSVLMAYICKCIVNGLIYFVRWITRERN